MACGSCGGNKQSSNVVVKSTYVAKNKVSYMEMLKSFKVEKVKNANGTKKT